MEKWASLLQDIVTSISLDEADLGPVINACDDPKVEIYLKGLPHKGIQPPIKDNSIIAELNASGQTAEATILNLTIHRSILENTNNPGALSASEKIQISDLFDELIASCRNHPDELSPSAYFILRLNAGFYGSEGDFEAEKNANDEALKILRHQTLSNKHDQREKLADFLYNLGILYSQRENFSASLNAYKEARDIGILLIQNGSASSKHSLAITLNNLGNLQGRTGDSEAALISLSSAIAIYRELIEECFHSCEEDLALSLISIGKIHFTKKDFEQAKLDLKEACHLYETLSEIHPTQYQTGLALALRNLGGTYGQNEELALALECFEKACVIDRNLASSGDPDACNGLASTLNNLAIIYFKQGHFQLCQDAFQECWQVRSRLSVENPLTFGGDLASLLKNLGMVHRKLGNHTAALKSQNEACNTFRILSEKAPEVYSASFADALNGLGVQHRALRNFSCALIAHKEALPIRNKLAQREPDIHRGTLATTYNNIGVLYYETRQFTQARIAYEHAHDIRKQLVLERPKVYSSDLAMTLNNLGILYRELELYEQALDVLQKALSIYRMLSASSGKLFTAKVADSLSNLSNLYERMGNFEVAIKTGHEACDIREALVTAGFRIYERPLAQAMSNLGKSYRASGDILKALDFHQKAYDVLVDLDSDNFKGHQSELSIALNNLGVQNNDLGNFIAANETFTAAVEHAENEIFDSDFLSLVKGKIHSAYKHLLTTVSNEPVRAFALAATMRESGVRSSSIDRSDLTSTQKVLAQRSHRYSTPNIILVPTSSGKNNSLTLGLITPERCQWWVLECKEWSNLLVHNPEHVDHRARRELAREIWLTLPEELKFTIIDTIKQAGDIYISGDSEWSAFPWELLRYDEGNDEYLGLQQALPRIGSILASGLEKHLNVKRLGSGKKNIAVIAPHTTGKVPLYGVLDEVKAIRKSVQKLGYSLNICEIGDEANDTLMLQAIRSQPDILYFSGHGKIVSKEEMLVLHTDRRVTPPPQARKTYFGAYHIDQLAEEAENTCLMPNSPLVVLNSCFTGGIRTHGGDREDLIQAFLRNGSGAIIATPFPIFDDIGMAFGEALFTAQATPYTSIGNLVVASRRELATKHSHDVNSLKWGSWAMIHIHGTSNAASPI